MDSNGAGNGAGGWPGAVGGMAVAGEVAVRFGPVVNTGQVPVPGTEPAASKVGRARLAAPVAQQPGKGAQGVVQVHSTIAIWKVVLRILPKHLLRKCRSFQ